MSLINFKKNRQKWDKLSIHEKVEILRQDNKNPSLVFFASSNFWLGIALTLIVGGVAIYYPYLANASQEQAKSIVAELFSASNWSMVFAIVFYFAGLGFNIYHYKKKKKVYKE